MASLHISEDEYHILVSQGRIVGKIRELSKLPINDRRPRIGKAAYAGGKRADLDGQYFRSAWEANYARYLNWAHIPWEYECKIFTFPVRRGVTEYRPDFYLPQTNEWHEVKGWMDSKSKTALKRFAKYYPNERLVLIMQPFFTKLHTQGIPALIPGWE